jgi:hypothetical protein
MAPRLTAALAVRVDVPRPCVARARGTQRRSSSQLIYAWTTFVATQSRRSDSVAGSSLVGRCSVAHGACPRGPG